MVSLQRAQTPVCTRGLDEKTRARLPPQETNLIANEEDKAAPRTSAATRPTPRTRTAPKPSRKTVALDGAGRHSSN